MEGGVPAAVLQADLRDRVPARLTTPGGSRAASAPRCWARDVGGTIARFLRSGNGRHPDAPVRGSYNAHPPDNGQSTPAQTEHRHEESPRCTRRRGFPRRPSPPPSRSSTRPSPRPTSSWPRASPTMPSRRWPRPPPRRGRRDRSPSDGCTSGSATSTPRRGLRAGPGERERTRRRRTCSPPSPTSPCAVARPRTRWRSRSRRSRPARRRRLLPRSRARRSGWGTIRVRSPRPRRPWPPAPRARWPTRRAGKPCWRSASRRGGGGAAEGGRAGPAVGARRLPLALARWRSPAGGRGGRGAEGDGGRRQVRRGLRGARGGAAGREPRRTGARRSRRRSRATCSIPRTRTCRGGRQDLRGERPARAGGAAYRQAVTADPAYGPARFGQIQAELNRGNREGAIAEAKKIAAGGAMSPGDRAADRRGRGAAQDNTARSRSWRGRRRACPATRTAGRSWAARYHAMGRYDDAAEAYKKAVELAPQNLNYRVDLRSHPRPGEGVRGGACRAAEGDGHARLQGRGGLDEPGLDLPQPRTSRRSRSRPTRRRSSSTPRRSRRRWASAGRTRTRRTTTRRSGPTTRRSRSTPRRPGPTPTSASPGATSSRPSSRTRRRRPRVRKRTRRGPRPPVATSLSSTGALQSSRRRSPAASY